MLQVDECDKELVQSWIALTRYLRATFLSQKEGEAWFMDRKTLVVVSDD
jgi:hypothetical protein